MHDNEAEQFESPDLRSSGLPDVDDSSHERHDLPDSKNEWQEIMPVSHATADQHVEVVQDIEAVRVDSKQPIHTVFTKHQKYFIVFMAAFGGFFSPLSANIYLPALNILSSELHVSDSLINLTLTSYMIFQGLAPSIMGDFADNAGRRPAYIIGFVIYIGANVGLALQRDYAALFVLRCMQSSGSSSTIALASGVIADIATAAERGTWMGIAFAGSLLGPAIGPIIGGLLAQFLGWPAIFWFLTILASVYLIIFFIAFPETGRKIVGDGSIPPPKLNWSFINYVYSKKAMEATVEGENGVTLVRTRTMEEVERKKRELRAQRKLRWPNPLRTLRLLLEKDVGLLLLFNSLVYTAFYDVAASTPSLFQEIYGFDELQIGLAFIPYGFGCCIATFVWGRCVDWNFRRLATKCDIPYERKRAMDLKNFPLEKARLQICLPLVYIGAAVILCYGWAIQVNAPLAPVLVLHFLVGFVVTGAFNVMSTMMVDLYPQSPATATACNNLVRCLVGAAGTALIIQMLDAMGRGWCFTFIALVIVGFSPMLWLVYFKGAKWREARRVRLENVDAATLPHEKLEQEKALSMEEAGQRH